MALVQNKLILWTGRKHSGKTTSAGNLARVARDEGFNVAGLLAPSVYRNGKLIGFDALDLGSKKRARLAEGKTNGNETEQFTFTTAGVKLGSTALSPASTRSADLIIVDEFGPLEICSKGWRRNVDSLLSSSEALVLLVVRRELTDCVRQLYATIPSQQLLATEPQSIDKVITVLRNRRNFHHQQQQNRDGMTVTGEEPPCLLSKTETAVKLDGMLMIGSAGTNLGKTELACALIKKFSKAREIVGIKVTTIKAKDGRCPRGGQGCGVCSSLDGNFTITEETESNSKKDTARLLAAGASRVLWLRVLKTYLKEGLNALLDIIGPDAISICESNSLRQVVEPGLFLMVKGRNSKVWKGSAQKVRKYADRIVVAGACGFDFDTDQIKLSPAPIRREPVLNRCGRKWTMPIKATAIIMAGGDSRRMGADKSMLPIEGRPMIKRICEQLQDTFDQILISTNEADKYAFLGLAIIPDRIRGQGPLMGIASALEASASELNFVVACDIPHIDMSLVRKVLAEVEGFDAVIPTTSDEKYEPLFAVYRKSALEAVNEVLDAGGRKISDVFARCRVKYIELEAGQLTNLNTMAEYEEFRKKFGVREINGS